ncbi:hypothetical protein DAPPUDRAFT_233154 [Daphnia pulex]|uniref:Uncharacterized protein n=1 Tax=Daphnia pulex TaxID=6669 RepID=E9FTD7_DAPPU|nr:hypothetical protein DAPPUDRAFT_233154 [Daphnia pulex]|eukprot:EFX89346.1 hypothetical protein DAPPUDRAFT_233154 [Daphnia pulex]
MNPTIREKFSASYLAIQWHQRAASGEERRPSAASLYYEMTMLPNRSSVTVVITDVSQGGHTGGCKKNATNVDLNGLNHLIYLTGNMEIPETFPNGKKFTATPPPNDKILDCNVYVLAPGLFKNFQRDRD